MVKCNTNSSFCLPVRVTRAVDRTFKYNVKKDVIQPDGTVVKVKTDEVKEVTRKILQLSFTDSDGFDSLAIAFPARDYSVDINQIRGDVVLSVEEFSIPRGSDLLTIVFNGYELVKSK